MRYEKEAIQIYRTANRTAIRAQRTAEKQGTALHPTPMNSILAEDILSYTIDLGVREIPVNQIVGIASASEKSNEYTADFLPLTSGGSKLSHQWCQLYASITDNTGITNPIRCYEYLGKFYVQDGMKRVSVLKYLGIETVSAQVVRYMPKRTVDKAIQNYYEFLIYYRQTQLYQLVFSQPGDFYKLQSALGYEPGHVWDDKERHTFMLFWGKFQDAFRSSIGGQSLYTAADYLVAFLADYPFDHAQKMSRQELVEAIRIAQRNLGTDGYIHKAEPSRSQADHIAKKSRIRQFCAYVSALCLFKEYGKNAIIRAYKEKNIAYIQAKTQHII